MVYNTYRKISEKYHIKQINSIPFLYMTLKELRKLKKRMPRGWRAEMLKRLNDRHSKSAIDAVMRGDYNNDEIIDTAIQLAEENKAKVIARKEKLSSL